MTELIVFAITVLVGFFGSAVAGAALNWPDAGAIFAIAAVGTIIFRKMNDLEKKNRN